MERSEIKVGNIYQMLPHSDYMSEEQAASSLPATVKVISVQTGYSKAGFDLLVKFTSVREFTKYFGNTPEELGFETGEEFESPLIIEADSEFITELPSEADLLPAVIDQRVRISETIQLHIYRKEDYLAVSIWALDKEGKATSGKPISQHTYDLEALEFYAFLDMVTPSK